MLNQALKTEETLIPFSDEWWREQARIVGATSRQLAFARAMVENPGAKFNKVAELSGITGTPGYLRTAGSELANHPKVKKLYEIALLAKSDEEVEIAYPPELLRHLSEIARNDTSTTNRLKANDLLLKYHDKFQEPQHSDEGLLDKLSKNPHPIFVLLALHYAKAMGHYDWRPEDELMMSFPIDRYTHVVRELGVSEYFRA